MTSSTENDDRRSEWTVAFIMHDQGHSDQFLLVAGGGMDFTGWLQVG